MAEVGRGRMKRKDSFWLSLPQSLGIGDAFWHNLKDLSGGGKRRSWGFRILELGSFPFEERP